MRYKLAPGVVSVERSFDVVIESCGAQPLSVSDVTFEGVPELYFESVIEPFVLPGSSTDPSDARPSQIVSLSFLSNEVGDYQGTLFITSNDPSQPELRIPISVQSRSLLAACPSARVVNESPLEITARDIILLDGSSSFNFNNDDEVLTYEWVVVERPAGSTAQVVERYFNPADTSDGGLSDDLSTPYGMFYADMVGEYIFRLVVTNNLNLRSPSDRCPQPEEETTIIVNSVPNEAIYVTLTWSTPGDEDLSDPINADVDLYFRHPRAERWATGFDIDLWTCNYANPNPDWGSVGPEGNPQLNNDLSSVNYESLLLSEPEFTDQISASSAYRIGVHYYASTSLLPDIGDFGPSNVIIKVYFREDLVGTFERELTSTGHFWEVADITWTQDEQSIEEVNAYYDMVP